MKVVLVFVALWTLWWTAWSQIAPDAVVAQDGTGNYAKIADAVAAAPRQSARRYYIRIKQGVYEETVLVESQLINLAFIGDGMDKTIISGDKSFNNGGLYDAATVVILGNGFMAQDITFQNTAGPEKQQAVALLVESTESAFYRCRIAAYQDTLYTKAGYQYYRDCEISGTVDIIFGDAKAVIQNCMIYARKPLQGQANTIVAQARQSNSDDTGIVIHNSIISAAPELQSAEYEVKTYLARPWGDYSRTVFMQCFMDSLIDPAGWINWDNRSPNLNTIYYAEYDNSGPGSNTYGRANWQGYRILRSADSAAQFTAGQFIQGNSWIPTAGVPYTSGFSQQAKPRSNTGYYYYNGAQPQFKHDLKLKAVNIAFIMLFFVLLN